jgi:hypothetical protein
MRGVLRTFPASKVPGSSSCPVDRILGNRLLHPGLARYCGVRLVKSTRTPGPMVLDTASLRR